MEEDYECRYDYVEISDGVTKPVRLCGNILPLNNYTWNANNISVTFEADSSIYKTGFKLRYEFIEGKFQCILVIPKFPPFSKSQQAWFTRATQVQMQIKRKRRNNYVLT